MSKLSRRQFIKITSAGLGAAAISGGYKGGFDLLAAQAAEALPGDLIAKSPIVCDLCFWQCAGWAYTKNGKPWKIVGNENDPHSQGRMCTRGSGGWGSYLDPDRLQKPLIRVNGRGKQEFREASWEEALDYTAKKLLEVRDKHGPESVALFSHGSGGSLFKRLLKAYGSGNVTAPSYSQCRGPRATAFVNTFGKGVDSPETTDIRNTKCLVLIGSHIGENVHNNQVSEFSEAIDNGATIIAVDPRFSVAASKAKYYLPIKPSTDLALLLAWIHVVIEEGLYDKEYIERYTHGFDELKEHVKAMTPEWAAAITEIDPEVIRQTAREMGAAAPAVCVHPGRHVTWYGDDTQRSRAVAILNAILGSWGRPGGFYSGERVKVPPFPCPPFPKPKVTWRDMLDGRYPLALSSLASGICDATIPGSSDYHFKSWIVYSTNLIKTLPNIPNTIEAIQNLDFLLVIDTMPMDITGWADVVLPECTYLERHGDLRISPHREPNIAVRLPATEPLYDSKPGWWMVKQLADRLGLEEYFTCKDVEQMISYRLKEAGTDLEEMRRVGVKKYQRRTKLYPQEHGEEVKFRTPTEKIELYSTKFEKEGFDPLPKYTEHEQPPADFYRLVYGRAPMHSFSRTTNNPKLTQLMEENDIWVNPRVAEKWGLKNGQRIKLKNQDGAVSTSSAKIRVTERIREDCVFTAHGFGHLDKRLSRGYKRGLCDNELITKVHIDPLMGGTGMRGNFVTFVTEI